MKKSAFTLAEIMIVLTVIGILTGILMPIAFHSSPDEDVMKFKKAHNTFTTAIRELVNSDKYYLDGFLDTKADGSLVDSETYLCETIADIINAKEKDCTVKTPIPDAYAVGYPRYNSTYDAFKGEFDIHCGGYAEAGAVQTYFKTSDNVTFFEVNPSKHFGVWDDDISTTYYRRITEPDGFKIYQVCKAYCFDIDDVSSGVPPFGYGVCVDGKIITGHVVDEWLEKSIQKGE